MIVSDREPINQRGAYAIVIIAAFAFVVTRYFSRFFDISYRKRAKELDETPRRRRDHDIAAASRNSDFRRLSIFRNHYLRIALLNHPPVSLVAQERERRTENLEYLRKILRAYLKAPVKLSNQH